ncbi:hypothetical protein [Massilia sp. TSP1-1-2]
MKANLVNGRMMFGSAYSMSASVAAALAAPIGLLPVASVTRTR